jgi:uncharacterized protein (TIGR00297 family)
LIWNWMIGILGSLAIAMLAYQRRSLSGTGAAAAVVLGTFMYALGSLAWFGTLIAFFISSTLLSKVKHKRKAAAESGYAKSGRRDAGQVLANGGIGLLLCLGNAIWPHSAWWACYIGVMATVNADTWATEIGGLSRRMPRSIVTGKRVEAGTSGGITGLGLVASMLGGLFIGGMAWLFARAGASPYGANIPRIEAGVVGEGAAISLMGLLLVGLLGGLIGSLIDSWLGATVQVMYRCEDCGKEVEKRVHCNVPGVRIRGIDWMTNDAVNMTSSLIGGLVAFLLFRLL